MAKDISQPGKIHLRIVEVMKRFPEGISCDQIRHELEREGVPAEDIGHLGRRIRELDKWFIIEKTTITQTAKSTGQVIGDEGQIPRRYGLRFFMRLVAVASAAARPSRGTASPSW